jgi:hypothetical protein
MELTRLAGRWLVRDCAELNAGRGGIRPGLRFPKSAGFAELLQKRAALHTLRVIAASTCYAQTTLKYILPLCFRTKSIDHTTTKDNFTGFGRPDFRVFFPACRPQQQLVPMVNVEPGCSVTHVYEKSLRSSRA